MEKRDLEYEGDDDLVPYGEALELNTEGLDAEQVWFKGLRVQPLEAKSLWKLVMGRDESRLEHAGHGEQRAPLPSDPSPQDPGPPFHMPLPRD